MKPTSIQDQGDAMDLDQFTACQCGHAKGDHQPVVGFCPKPCDCMQFIPVTTPVVECVCGHAQHVHVRNQDHHCCAGHFSQSMPPWCGCLKFQAVGDL